MSGDWERLHRLTEAESVADLAALVREHADAIGYSSFIYALRAPTAFAGAEVILVKGYPDEWLERYWERDYYTIDPVIAHCVRHVTPTAWQALGPRSSVAARKMMGEASEFGLSDGLSMPVHGSRGELGILSVAGASQRRSPAAERHALATVQLLGAHVHEAVRRVSGLVEPPVRLSSRERECLRWAADGKTSWEISQIFDIAERTVNFHFDNAVAKLGASNRQHAIAKAIALRIVGPHPF